MGLRLNSNLATELHVYLLLKTDQSLHIPSFSSLELLVTRSVCRAKPFCSDGNIEMKCLPDVSSHM